MKKNVGTGFIFLIAVVLMGCMVAASAASAMDGRHRHHGKAGENGELGFLKQLDLTDAQKSGIQEILGKYDSQLDALRSDIHQARQEMRNAMNAAAFSEESLRTVYRDKLSPLLENRVVLHAKMKSEIRPLLTEEQIKQSEEKMESGCRKNREQCDHRKAMMKRCPRMNVDETP